MTSKHGDLFRAVEGVFYRAVDRAHLGSSLSGSRQAGRYSNPDQPTLYLSSSRAGVKAAMIAHASTRRPDLEIVEVYVRADHIFDLRDDRLRASAGLSLEDALAPWQELVAQGKRPSSWQLRDRLIGLGAQGLIDPSRKAPPLWHLVLFAWNKDGAPQVHLTE